MVQKEKGVPIRKIPYKGTSKVHHIGRGETLDQNALPWGTRLISDMFEHEFL